MFGVRGLEGLFEVKEGRGKASLTPPSLSTCLKACCVPGPV